jgi:hypothetical protein
VQWGFPQLIAGADFGTPGDEQFGDVQSSSLNGAMQGRSALFVPLIDVRAAGNRFGNFAGIALADGGIERPGERSGGEARCDHRREQAAPPLPVGEGISSPTASQNSDAHP